MKLHVFVTDIAALLGKNPYKSKEQAILDILVRNGLKQATPESTHLRDVSNNLQSMCAETRGAVLVATSNNEELFERHKQSLIGNLEKIAPVGSLSEPQKAQVIQQCLSETNCLCGTIAESSIVKAFEQMCHCAVRGRGRRVFVEGSCWKLSGRIDGIAVSEGDSPRLIECKRRKSHFFVPEYDLIQIKCYLGMLRFTKAPICPDRGILVQALFRDQIVLDYSCEISCDAEWFQGICRVLDDIFTNLNNHME